MKILHTGDWHLGKYLEGISRLEEQEKFLEDFVELVEENDVDLILIAGDIYDAFNPPSHAEILFYSTLKKLSLNGERMIVIIAGNHDNPSRLVAAGPLARDHGIIMVDQLETVIEQGIYGQNKVLNSGRGFIEIEINHEKAVVLTVPYPSEKRLNDAFYQLGDSDEDHLESYQDKINKLFTELEGNFREDTINLLVSHLFATGAEETGSERSIQLGGTFIVDSSCFPKKADYVALGHIHKPMVIKNTEKKVRYSGSPLHYNKKEVSFKKGCYLVEIKGKETEIEFLPFKVYKPIESWHFKSVDEAITHCEAHSGENSFVYMTIETDEFIKEHEIKKMKRLKSDILEITPIFDKAVFKVQNITEEPIEDIFKAFYTKKNGQLPSEELIGLFNELVGGKDETD